MSQFKATLSVHNTFDLLPLSVTLALTGIVVAYALWIFADRLRKGPKGIL